VGAPLCRPLSSAPARWLAALWLLGDPGGGRGCVLLAWSSAPGLLGSLKGVGALGFMAGSVWLG